MQRARKLFILYRPISKSKLRCSIWRLKFFQHFFPCYKNVTFILRFIPLCSFILACKNNILIILPNVLFQFYTVHHFYPVFSYFIFVYVILERVIEEKKKKAQEALLIAHITTHTHTYFILSHKDRSVTEIYRLLIFSTASEYKIEKSRIRARKQLVSFEFQEVNRIHSDSISRYLERRGSANKHATTETRNGRFIRWRGARCNTACLLFEMHASTTRT